MISFAQIKEKWDGFDLMTRLTVVGTIVLVIVSIMLTAGNVGNHSNSYAEPSPESGTSTSEEALIQQDAQPIPSATKETKLADNLLSILSNNACSWTAEDDELCLLVFTKNAFEEYAGDIKTSATFELFSIEVIDSGRRCTWRVTYDDGTQRDALLLFTQGDNDGTYYLESDAFPTYTKYKTRAISSQDVLAW